MDLIKSRIDTYEESLKAARGEIPIDTVIQGASVLNVLTGDLLEGDVGIHKGFIVSLFAKKTQAHQRIDGGWKTVIPSFIDPHVHIESSMVLPTGYAEIVAANGTGTIFADPHEIVNVMGVDGFSLMLKNSKGLPLRMFFDASTCVPSKRGAETSGADIRSSDIRKMIEQGSKKLGELMSIEEIISGDPIMTEIVKTGWTLGIPRDAHFPMADLLGEAFGSLSFTQKLGVYSGFIGAKLLRLKRFNALPSKILVNKLRELDHRALDAYIVALGLTADHENYGPELQIKLDHGMRLMLSSHIFSIPEMLPLLVASVNKLRYKDPIGICTDDIWPDELVKKGGMVGVVRGIVGQGVDPIDAVRFATLNNAQRLAQAGVREAALMGAVAPGLVADLVLVSGSLKKFKIDTVIHEGTVVAKNGKLLSSLPDSVIPQDSQNTVKVSEISEETFVMRAPQSAQSGAVLTRILSLPPPPAMPFPELLEEEVPVKEGVLETQGYTIITVINRYGKQEKSPSKGLIKGFPLREGAVASTVAHDSHNLIVMGTNVSEMSLAANRVVEMKGGMVATKGEEIIASIALPVGGLMSAARVEEISKSAEEFRHALEILGLDPKNPMFPFAIFSLPAVPGAKVTDLGLWDGEKKKLVPLFV